VSLDGETKRLSTTTLALYRGGRGEEGRKGKGETRRKEGKNTRRVRHSKKEKKCCFSYQREQKWGKGKGRHTRMASRRQRVKENEKNISVEELPRMGAKKAATAYFRREEKGEEGHVARMTVEKKKGSLTCCEQVVVNKL